MNGKQPVTSRYIYAYCIKYTMFKITNVRFSNILTSKPNENG